MMATSLRFQAVCEEDLDKVLNYHTIHSFVYFFQKQNSNQAYNVIVK